MKLPVDATTCTILGNHYKQTDAAWTGLALDRAKVRTQSTIMLMLIGEDAHYDLHLDVPWCHPSDQTGSPDDFDCVYRVRPKMEPGKKWKGRIVKSVSFEREDNDWWLIVMTDTGFSLDQEGKRQRQTNGASHTVPSLTTSDRKLEMSEMIERVAVEFMRKSLEGCEAEFIRACEPRLCRCRFFARAAIEAMREPSQAMLEASWHNVREVKPDDRMAVLLMSTSMAHRVKTLNRWRAMIDAALASPPTEIREES